MKRELVDEFVNNALWDIKVVDQIEDRHFDKLVELVINRACLILCDDAFHANNKVANTTKALLKSSKKIKEHFGYLETR